MNVFTDISLPGVFRTWTDFSQPVPRRVYILHGMFLATAKYAGDVLLVYAATRTFWPPTRYLQALPTLIAQGSAIDWWLAPAMALWMLPFVALGLTLTMRRAIDGNLSPMLATLFLIPYLNYAVIAGLCLRGSDHGARDHHAALVHLPRHRAAVLAIGAGVLVGVAAVALGVGLMRIIDYGAWLFVLTPFVMGSSTAFVYQRRGGPQIPGPSAFIVLTVLLTGAVLVTGAFEGVICLAMALPLAIPLALIGGLVGRRAAEFHHHGTPAMFMLLALPLTAAVEPATGHQLHEVRSAVVINAPPGVVWPTVVAFPEIQPPDDWLFRAGIAYPVRARIDGVGIGAVRYCVFSTGAFVEPITQWDPERRLSFDVVTQPPSMRELSPYELSPRHLHGYLRARRGEFRLIDLGDGRTRLEGSTWYEIQMAPEAYWQIFSDTLIHRIHQRVLDHIRHEAERSLTSDRAARS